MSKESNIIKRVVKTNAADKATFGTNPQDPWSARSGLNETPLLNRYLKSRGINPEFASKDQKVAHSKTTQFKKWMIDHMNDPVTESVDKKDTITFDIPLLIRVLEFAREELKSDVNLHKMVERLICMRGKGTLTMNQYGVIVKEEIESERLDEISAELQHRYFKAAYAQKNDKTVPKDVRKKRSTGMNKVVNRTLRRNTISTPGAEKDFKDQEAKRGIGHVRDHVEVEGAVFEAKEANYGGDYQASVLTVKAKAEKKPVDMKSLAARMQASYRRDNEQGKQGKPVKENTEPMAACSQPGDGANNPGDVEPMNKGKKLIQMSKAAKIKSIVKEDLYDTEKEDKSVAGLKKPKVQKQNADDETKQAPQAAAILKGGKTLTGEPRDTIELDPMMKMRKSSDTSPEQNRPKKSY